MSRGHHQVFREEKLLSSEKFSQADRKKLFGKALRVSNLRNISAYYGIEYQYSDSPEVLMNGVLSKMRWIESWGKRGGQAFLDSHMSVKDAIEEEKVRNRPLPPLEKVDLSYDIPRESKIIKHLGKQNLEPVECGWLFEQLVMRRLVEEFDITKILTTHQSHSGVDILACDGYGWIALQVKGSLAFSNFPTHADYRKLIIDSQRFANMYRTEILPVMVTAHGSDITFEKYHSSLIPKKSIIRLFDEIGDFEIV